MNDTKRKIAERTPTRQEMGLPEHAFVFCCFNNNWKITPTIFDIWMRLLHQVEGSVLWLLGDNEGAERNLRKEAQRRGIDPSRLVFAGRLPPAEHLARHRLADLFLDTLPYNAHTTASDALWAGLPVLTCKGEAFAGRVAASLLHAVGIPELITSNLEDYQTLALKLARDPALLAEIKARLVIAILIHCSIPNASPATSKLPTRRCGRLGSAVKHRRALASNPSARPAPWSCNIGSIRPLRR